MTEMTWDGFRPLSNMSDISFVMGMFLKNSRIAQSVHPFSMNSNDFRSFLLCFSLKCNFQSKNHRSVGKPNTWDCIYREILSWLNCFIYDSFCRIMLWVSALSPAVLPRHLWNP